MPDISAVTLKNRIYMFYEMQTPENKQSWFERNCVIILLLEEKCCFTLEQQKWKSNTLLFYPWLWYISFLF